ncbi:hypothetical protein SCHPADRAFT_449278 [Schizopora paradoxa]|uniref:DUF6534 domain-containing protein n=1 Tax=Schizopora paradoxa TaxID=27342 RepID=A0A0H2RIP4_9AGAM|nr:hypothetical protein SCHPADRAFT_449278 [Schizopora paradoxa]
MENLFERLNAVYWGCMLSMGLFGVTLMQTHTYFSKNEDGIRRKAFVASIVLLEVISMALQMEVGYHYLVRNFGQDSAIGTWARTFIAEMFTSCFICFLSQMFCARNVFILTKGLYGRKLRTVLTGTIVLLSVTSLCNHIDMSWKRNCRAQSSATGFMSDVIATGTMCFVLSSFMSDFKPTNRLASCLISYSIHRWVIISVFLTFHFVLYTVRPASWLWVPFHLNISRLHVISLLALLNSRDRMHTPVILSSMKFGDVPGNNPAQRVDMERHFEVTRPVLSAFELTTNGLIEEV